MTESVKKFKAEMEQRGLFRKITVAVNLIPPPPGVSPADLTAFHQSAAKSALRMYADKHDDFFEIFMDAALDHLMEDVLTDDLFAPDAGFTPTAEETANMDRAKATAELLNGLFSCLGGLAKHI